MHNRFWLHVGFVITSFFGIVSLMHAQEPAASTSHSAATNNEDPYLWLEDVLGDKAIEWVKARNKTSQAKLEADPGFATLRDDLLAILDSDARIPMISKHGEYYYNFWRDKKNERGLWRRTTLEEYKKTEPKWEILLDLDELGKDEKENWVWSGASLLRPDYNRALINLSRGGADATVTREFDLEKKRFVSDGFSRPESKGQALRRSPRWKALRRRAAQTPCDRWVPGSPPRHPECADVSAFFYERLGKRRIG